MNRSPEAVSVEARSSRPSLRHEARMTSPIRVPTTAGRPVSSASLPATRPMIPTGHGPWSSSAGESMPAPTVTACGSGTSSGNSGSWPGTTLGSGRPSATLASAIAARIRSRRVAFAASRVAASSAASAASSARRSRAASSASPTRPAAFRRGAIANPTVSRSADAGLTPAFASSAAMPGRGDVRICSRPSLAIARFSPSTGTTSDTVPITASSASGSASASPDPSSASSSRATVKATPLPDSPRPGYSLSARCGFTSATAAGSTSGSRWWSVTATSIPRARAAATSATLVEPVSTVTISVMPSPAAASTAASERPWPSSSREGTYGVTRIPSRRNASTSCARPVSPSASKSPKTMTRSPRSRARATRSTRAAASGSSRGSLSPAAAGPRNAASVTGSAMPRRAMTVAANVPTPSSRAAARSIGSSRYGSGNTQRCRASVIGRRMPRRAYLPLGGAVGGMAGRRGRIDAGPGRRRAPGSRGRAAAWASRSLPLLAAILPEVPHDEERARVEDREVRPRDDPEEQCQHERADRRAGEEQQRQQRDHDREAGGDRPAERLEDRVVDDPVERLAGVARAVLTDPVEHDDRVVHGEADDRQHRGHEQAVDLEPEERPEDRERADDDQDVVEERDQGADAHLEVAEAVRDPEQDADRPEQDQRQGLHDEVARDDGADGRQRLLLGDRPEGGLERVPDLAELALRWQDPARHRRGRRGGTGGAAGTGGDGRRGSGRIR